MSSATLRPGILLGDYPEKSEDRGTLPRSALARLRPRWKKPRNPGGGMIVRRVLRHARGLEALDDAQIETRTRELRTALTAQGLRDKLLLQTFALVREVAGRTLDIRHYDTQLFAGWIMVKGMLAEMQTGEGKTLAASLPAASAALAGIPVHVITANDYLAERDADQLRPLYETLGLRVGAVTATSTLEERQHAYGCDITYCSNSQVAFDYLYDRLVLSRHASRLQTRLDRLDPETSATLRLRGLCFAIVDEADSVLIDDARTPVKLARSGDDNDYSEAFNQALQLAGQLTEGRHFLLDSQRRKATLTDDGRQALVEPCASLSGIWRHERRREQVTRLALAALHLYRRDEHYLVRNGKIVIVDTTTGRAMADRSWDRGLHQMVQAKEACPVSSRQETLASISYQRFFKRYLHLAGMSGTAAEVSRELLHVYDLRVVKIPTHRASRRRQARDAIYRTQESKWRAILDDVQRHHDAGQAVLIGTRTVADSELISKRLRDAGLRHRILNARQDRQEARIIARAGQRGRITVATNMAGRGTDIGLASDVRDCGGLHVIIAERQEARRLDRQLAGRCARQGDPGSVSVFLSLEDPVLASNLPAFARSVLSVLARRDKPVLWRFGARPVRRAQRRMEELHAETRSELVKADRRLERLLAFAGNAE